MLTGAEARRVPLCLAVFQMDAVNSEDLDFNEAFEY